LPRKKFLRGIRQQLESSISDSVSPRTQFAVEYKGS